MNQVVYNKSLNILASSGVEKVIKVWSEFDQELFPNSSIESTKSNNRENSLLPGSSNLGRPGHSYWRQHYITRITARNSEEEQQPLENDDDDEDIIAFFDALREATPARVQNESSSTNRVITHPSDDESDNHLSDQESLGRGYLCTER